MASQEITVLTVATPFPTRNDFNEAQGLRTHEALTHIFHPLDKAIFTDAVSHTLQIEDDNDQYESLFNPNGDLSQALLNDFDFGFSGDETTSDVSPAGTLLGFRYVAQIRDDLGNHFVAIFPYNRDTPDAAPLGGRRSVLLFALGQKNLVYAGSQRGTRVIYDILEERTDPETKLPIPSVFDKSAVFHYVYRSDNSEEPTYSGPVRMLEPPPAKCFAQGSLIQTPNGRRAVETFQKGDLVLTYDNGAQPILWVGHTVLSHKQLVCSPHLWPIRILKGALGPDFPDQDLTVSPQHRILVRSVIARRMFDVDEILVAAKHLLKLPGITAVCPKDGVSYWHILLPDHALVLSHGTWTESFFIGPYTLQSMDDEARSEFVDLFPELAQPDYEPNPARHLITGREGRKLAERHAKNGKPLIAQPDHSRLQSKKEIHMSMT